MNDLSHSPKPSDAAASGVVVPLSAMKIGETGVIVDVAAGASNSGGSLSGEELQRRLLEFGFVEGAQVEVLHEGAIGHDPIAVRVDDMRVAVRRRDARNVDVLLERSRP